ncbi:MAG: LysR family transcriptional regulator [Clostridiales bacterium]|nr:LysR family transcriptional regulator [Clostridiales bacterium]MCD8132756.1 LysR family transcriptional regulator [Clostridiales bacterium]
MDIKYFNEFRVLADVCNYQEAAERLYISLSALSKHISKLEQELGVSLFNRTTRKVSLSEYGSLFYRYAVQITDSYNECSRALAELQEDSILRLRIAFQPLLTEYSISETLAGFKHVYPDIQLSIMENVNPRDLLRTHQCDAAFHTEYGARRDMEHSLFLTADELVAVLPADHPLAETEFISMEQLREEKFIVKQEAYSDLNLIFQQLCAEAGFEPQVGCTIHYSSGMAKMVNAGMGIAVTNRKHVPENDVYQIRAIPIRPTVPFNIYLLYTSDKKNLFALQRFREYLSETITS